MNELVIHMSCFDQSHYSEQDTMLPPLSHQVPCSDGANAELALTNGKNNLIGSSKVRPDAGARAV